MSTIAADHATREQSGNALYAALARTATRTAGSPLFRTSRQTLSAFESGWQSLRGLAAQQGKSLNAEYLSWLVKNQGFMIIPKHFLPAIVINASLGTILWETYSMTNQHLEPHLGIHPTAAAALSGGLAGGVQALAAAPAENIRIVFEGGSRTGWSDAWKEVFRGTVPTTTTSSQRENVRKVRDWMTDVRGMAGRGWDGWGWGCTKDVCGFATFFAIFDLTRRFAVRTKAVSQEAMDEWDYQETRIQSFKRHFPRFVHGATLVTGGVTAGIAYEFVSRPFDAARRAVQHSKLVNESAVKSLVSQVREEGIMTFFRDPSPATATVPVTSAASRRMYAALRTLGRVGPWGIGFLVWEAFGPGLGIP